MLPRQSKNFTVKLVDVVKAKKSRKFVACLVAFEVVSLGVCWFGFDRLNNSSDNRRTLQKYWPSALEGYYYVSDTIAGNKIREEDRALWARTGSDSWDENGSS